MNACTIRASSRWTPPHWALMQRKLFEELNRASEQFVAKYANADGTLIWRKDWPGMDGSDDPYEGFMNLALLYAIGGSDRLLELANKLWDGITWQFTEYGQIHNEFDAYYDWMHHGEGYLFFYFLGLADPYSLKQRQRAIKFARMYTGEDPEAPNFDPERKLIRSPINGSRGPRFAASAEDWCTHRGILDDYLAPFEDLPNVDFASGKCPWSNDAVYADIIAYFNARMAKGDVPLNMNATSLLAHAYMSTGDESYKRWVLEYVKAWMERTRQNGGITPDNIGLSGQIGEYNDGKWWGGYYGWRWPHGFMSIIEPIVNATMNASLLSGDRSYLNLAREQLDRNWELGKRVDGRWVTPHKHFDAGWTDYRVPNPAYAIYLWTVSLQDEDIARYERIDIPSFYSDIEVPVYSGRNPITKKETKHYIANQIPWFDYIRGRNPDYPEQILAANIELLQLQLAKMESNDPYAWITDEFNEGALSSIHKWQEVCPAYFEGLFQLTHGAPMHISLGGLPYAPVRYFDADKRRPGLSNGVAALVDGLTEVETRLTLINTDLHESHSVIVQGGMFGEHQFTTVLAFNQVGEQISMHQADSKWVEVVLEPGCGLQLKLHTKRYSNSPTYEMPWKPGKLQPVITGRKKDEA